MGESTLTELLFDISDTEVTKKEVVVGIKEQLSSLDSKGKLGELSTLLEYSSTMLESSSVAACKFKHNA